MALRSRRVDERPARDRRGGTTDASRTQRFHRNVERTSDGCREAVFCNVVVPAQGQKHNAQFGVDATDGVNRRAEPAALPLLAKVDFQPGIGTTFWETRLDIGTTL